MKNPLLTPHFILTVICILYIIVGAFIFQALEKTSMTEMKVHNLNEVDAIRERYLDRVWHLVNDPSNTHRSLRHSVKEEWEQLVDSVYRAHTTTRCQDDKSVEDSTTWLFFTATMLTTIGYGFLGTVGTAMQMQFGLFSVMTCFVPFTFYGRMFCVVYCIIGIPLTLVTITNIAMFASEIVFTVHLYCWKLRLYWRHRNRQQGSDEENQQLLGEDENGQKLLDRVKLIRMSPTLIFLLVFCYGIAGTYLVYTREKWSFTDAMYFTFISILTVGFGDMQPRPDNLAPFLAMIMIGLILTTMCMDVVGRMYLQEVHYLGRKLRTTDPFHILREVKAKQRRQAIAMLLTQLAKNMAFSHRNFVELSTKKAKLKKRTKSYLLPDRKFMFARQPPDPPNDYQGLFHKWLI